MSSEMTELIRALNANPDSVYITADGHRLFTLVGPENKLMCATSLTKSFNAMTEEEVNEFIQNLLK